jgi:hypothetical protein
MPSMADGGKLLSNDAVYFDSVAWALAEEIRAYGWERWSLFVNPSATGNVGILAALYALFGHDPSLAIPINAGLHALGGVLIFFLAKELVLNSKIGTLAGVITGTLFVVFPSALNWYGQIHKDGYAIAGTLMLLLVWLKVLKTPTNIGSWVRYGIFSFIGIALIGIVRPYSLTLLFVVTIGALLFVILDKDSEGRLKNTARKLTFFFITLLMLFGAIALTKGYANQVDIKPQVKVESGWQWQDSEWVPDKLEGYIAAAAKTRATLIHHGKLVSAGSTIDENIAPQNIEEVIKYLPRALIVAMAAPFPSSWLKELNMVWLVATLEMLIYYLCIPGIFMFLFYNNKPKTWMTVYFASAFLTIFGFTIANMGTLFRVRYAYLFVLLLGVLGWLMFLERKGILRNIILFFKKESVISLKRRFFSNEVKTGRRQAVNSSISVMLLTFISFIGFFYRDILMAHTFGASAELDSFFYCLTSSDDYCCNLILSDWNGIHTYVYNNV